MMYKKCIRSYKNSFDHYFCEGRDSKITWISPKDNGLASVEVLAHFLVNRSVKAATVIIDIEVMLVSTKNNCWMDLVLLGELS